MSHSAGQGAPCTCLPGAPVVWHPTPQPELQAMSGLEARGTELSDGHQGVFHTGLFLSIQISHYTKGSSAEFKNKRTEIQIHTCTTKYMRICVRVYLCCDVPAFFQTDQHGGTILQYLGHHHGQLHYPVKLRWGRSHD